MPRALGILDVKKFFNFLIPPPKRRVFERLYLRTFFHFPVGIFFILLNLLNSQRKRLLSDDLKRQLSL